MEEAEEAGEGAIGGCSGVEFMVDGGVGWELAVLAGDTALLPPFPVIVAGAADSARSRRVSLRLVRCSAQNFRSSLHIEGVEISMVIQSPMTRNS